VKVKLSESYHISTVPIRKPTPAFQDLLKAIERARKERRQVKKG